MKQADIDRIWYGAEPVPLWMRLLVPVYRMLRAVVGLAWRSGLRKPTRLGVPVIVVGNITAGGTGKTPLVRPIDALRSRGWQPGWSAVAMAAPHACQCCLTMHRIPPLPAMSPA
jgi:tetraacyldisaccharide 4'-kinase